MTDTTGNFQDLLQFSADTLYCLGEEFVVGNSAASTVTFGLSNSAGSLAIIAAPSANATLSLPNGGTVLTNINISAGTTSSNVSAVTFSNANGVSFGFDGSNITATVQPGAAAGIAAIQAGTQTATSGTVVFSNSNNVSFGMSGTATVTASAQVNISAGTTSNNLSAITFANSNGISFGLGASTVTAMMGGMSSWENGHPVSSFGTSNAFLSLQPIVVPYNMSVTNLVWLAHLSGLNTTASSSGAWTISAGVYTQANTGSNGTLNLASSSSSNWSYNTAGAQYNSLSGTQYRQMSVSWNMTPGFYVFAFAGVTVNGGSHTFYGYQSNVSLVSAATSVVTTAAFVGFSTASITALPASIGISATAYVRTGSSVHDQPWIRFQGT